MRYITLCYLFLTSALFAQEPFCTFIPPKGWEAVEPSALHGQVKLAFIKKGTKEGFSPSLNLVIEPITGHLSNYLNDVKTIHEQNRNNRWRKLGKVHTTAGQAELTEIDTTTSFGPLRLLQLFFQKEGNVYIVTAAALKKDIPHLYSDFQKSFHSLSFSDDLFEAIGQQDKRNSLKEAEETLLAAYKQEPMLSEADFQKNYFLPFQKKVLEEYADLGPYWQSVFLKNTSEKIKAIP